MPDEVHPQGSAPVQAPDRRARSREAPPPPLPDRHLVAGTPISLTSYSEVLALLDRRPRDRALRVVCCNVHSVMTARRDPEVAAALRGADIATPDGMPLVWALRREARPDQERVYGPDLMAAALRHGVERSWTHYLYGATEPTLACLREAIASLAPAARIAGWYAPPFRPLDEAEERAVLAQLRRSRADIVWVGLGIPKQELWMQRVHAALPVVALLGVGAAFDLLSGTVRQAPGWVQDRGLEWLYRLAREPRRLAPRYLATKPAFMALMAREMLRR